MEKNERVRERQKIGRIREKRGENEQGRFCYSMFYVQCSANSQTVHVQENWPNHPKKREQKQLHMMRCY